MNNPFLYFPAEYFDIPLFFINRVDKIQDKKNYNNYLLEIHTKDNRCLKLVLDNNSKKFYGTLVTITNPKEIHGYLMPAMKYRESHPVNFDGWTVYDSLKEFQRQGVILDNEEGNLSYRNSEASNGFRMSFINKNFELCQTYPEIFLVPKKISDDDLREASNFRTKGRIPVLCYYKKDNNVSLWRSSQTRSGLTYQRNEKDEKLVQGIIDLMYKKNSNLSSQNKNAMLNKKLIIYDARPYLNALANRLKGAGFENTDYYKNTEICFCEIDNIHCVRNAFLKLNAILTNQKFLDNKNYFSQLEQTTWFNFIFQIIKTSVGIASSLKAGNSILIHCSDGWDRSPQLTAMSQIFIDPYYRTIEGLIVLIEKEWLSFGHQFRFRNGFYNLKDHSEDERAPIFLQWLDCIHQLIYQFPHMFEFNNELLVFIAYHIGSCKYGSFLFNSEFERNEKLARIKTVSIWTDVIENIENFVNPFYESSQSHAVKYFLPNFAFHKIRLWEEYYLKYLHFNNNFGKYYMINVSNSKYVTSDKKECLDGSKNEKIRNKKRAKIKTNYHYIEIEKLNDKKIIESQAKEIEKLNSIIKEITIKVLSKSTKSEIDRLSEDSKMYIAELTKNESIDEDEFVVIKNSVTSLINENEK
jgi:hypothetical protein